MKTAKEILSEYKPDTRSVHMNDVAWCTEKVLQAMDAYAAQFQQPTPEVKRDKYGVIETKESGAACDGCKYDGIPGNKEIHRHCYKNLAPNEHYKPE